MIPIIAVSFAVLLLLGIPVAFVIGVAGFIGLWWSGEYPLTVIVKLCVIASGDVRLGVPLNEPLVANVTPVGKVLAVTYV